MAAAEPISSPAIGGSISGGTFLWEDFRVTMHHPSSAAAFLSTAPGAAPVQPENPRRINPAAIAPILAAAVFHNHWSCCSNAGAQRRLARLLGPAAGAWPSARRSTAAALCWTMARY